MTAVNNSTNRDKPFFSQLYDDKEILIVELL